MNKTRRFALTAGLCLVSLAAAQSVQRTLSVVVNGQVVTAKAVVVKGETFVSLSVLGPLGIKSSAAGSTLSLTSAQAQGTPTAAPGGANQRSATEGCLGETLFNGLWRFRVISAEPLVRSETGGTPGWAVNLEFRNGTQKDISPTISFDAFGKGVYLIRQDGQNAGNLSGDGFYYTFGKRVPPGGVISGAANFYTDAPLDKWDAFKANRPTKLILSVLSTVLAKNEGLAYSTPTPTFRVNLTCRK
ncbi:hypothetical protein [Deinococcus alpinitundrae]|uniref:hypothetical protein n=1 Tax=Deinococcus alpinitundrae TaxID=468913 RepID=UPI00137AF4CE|nr:hypothetical protein [Deinococcus alpinitundrae]